MPDEGERGEGHENHEKDPFAEYAEELEKKYRESEGVDEFDQHTPISGTFTEKTAESPTVKRDLEEDEFEGYAKELREKYADGEGGTASCQDGKNDTDEDGEKPSEEGHVPTESGYQAPHDLKSDYNNPDAQQTTDPAVGDGKPELAESGGYQQNMVNVSRDLEAQTASPNSERPMNPPPDDPSRGRQRQELPEAVKSRSETPPKIAPAAYMKSREDQSVEVQKQKGLDDSGREADQKLTAAEELQPGGEPKVTQSIESNPFKQQPVGREIPEPLGPTADYTNPIVSGKTQTSLEFSERTKVSKVTNPIQDQVELNLGKHSDTRPKPVENQLRGVIEEPREIPVVLAGSKGRKDVYASVPKTIFQELTGTKLEAGKTYDIHFKIRGIGDSWTRHSESDYQSKVNASSIRLHFSNAYSDRLRMGTHCSIAIDYVTENRCLRVAKTHQGPALRIHEEILESAGFNNRSDRQDKNPVVELGVKNLSRNESRIDKCYTTLHLEGARPSRNVCRLMMKGLGAKEGDMMEIQYAKLHTIGDFAENFNSRRPKNLQNIRLAFDQDKLVMLVDGKDVPLLNPHLRTYKFEVSLNAEIRTTGKPISFEVDSQTAKITILHRLSVDGVRAPDSGLSTSFHLGRREGIRPKSLEHAYTDWKQVAGYFDGDGSPDFYVGKRVLHPALNFVDNYRPHVMMLRRFLISQGLSVHRPNHDQGGAWKIGVAQAESVRKMASMMLPHLFKKREEIQAILDYFDNRMTGTQLVEVFNESVRRGNRVGKIRIVDIPYTRQEGQKLSKRELRNHARKMGMENQKLPNELLEQIRVEYISGAATNGELAKKYGVRPATISRAVFGRNPKERTTDD